MQSQSQTILVIDDDVIALDIMSYVLHTAGYRMLVAEDGESGIRRAEFARPDLILLDVMMPGIDGFGVASALRANPRTRHIPIILLTCLGDEDSIIKGFRIGVDDYAIKTTRHEKLLLKIKNQLTSRRHDRLQHHFLHAL